MSLSHRMSHTRTFKKWGAMLSRCRNPNATGYPKYGARGIRVCERWHCFESFYADMGECPPGLSIDRIDNNGDYEPGNCRWATIKQQARNKRNTVLIEIGGVTKSLPEWCEIYGLHSSIVYTRMHRLGWSGEKAITTPKNPPRAYSITPEFRQALREKALRQWAQGGIGSNRRREPVNDAPKVTVREGK